jgi:hypothetical protein
MTGRREALERWRLAFRAATSPGRPMRMPHLTPGMWVNG